MITLVNTEREPLDIETGPILVDTVVYNVTDSRVQRNEHIACS
jgi:hypothetical protein